MRDSKYQGMGSSVLFGSGGEDSWNCACTYGNISSENKIRVNNARNVYLVIELDLKVKKKKKKTHKKLIE